MTIAKQIQDFPDYYVSSAGNVWREKNNGFYLKLRPNKQGQVQLYRNGKAKYMRVHRLVAQAFVLVPKQYQGMSIDELDIHHINFNHNDNRVSNLMWLSKAEHMQLHSDSEVTKQRISEAMRGKPKSEEHKRKMSDARKGKHCTEETKQRISEALKGKQKPEGSGSPPKVVAQYTKYGEFIAKYHSMHEAERRTNIAQQSICSCCRGKLKSAGGYKWRYV